jgi:DNA polymerase
MSSKKFKMTCASYGLNITDQLASKAVNSYRQYYPNVPKMWHALENGAIQCVLRGVKVPVGKIVFELKDEFLWCKLPSGRSLAYHKPQVRSKDTGYGERKELTYMSTSSTTKKYERQNTYGGRLIENIISGIARDILAYALVRCEKRRYTSVMHVHDEIVAEVPENYGSVDEFINILCEVPEWAKGCPITAEGWRKKRYLK